MCYVHMSPFLGLALVKNGDQVLDALGLANRSYKSVMKDLVVLTGINLLISWLGLSFFGPKFALSIDETIKVPALQNLITSINRRHKA